MAEGRRVIITHDGAYEFHTQAHDLHCLEASLLADNGEYVALLVDAWTSFLADSPLRPDKPSGGKGRAVFRSFRRRLLTQPLLTTITTFSSLADEISRQGTLTGVGSTTGSFVQAMTDTPVFPEYLHWFRTGDAACLVFVLSFLWFGKKAEIENPDLEPDALRKWLNVEERLANVNLDRSVTDDLRFLARLLLPVVYDLPFLGKHGPGTVAGGGRSTSIKMKQLTFDPLLDRAFFSTRENAWQRFMAHDPLSVIPNADRWIAAREKGDTSRKIRPAELMFVFKTIASMRSICREPAVMMYFQQSLRFELEASIASGPLHMFIDLTDQTLNQKACAFGSYTGMIDTIDLSAASDSVSWELVKAVFPARLLKKMYATRSSRVSLPDGTVVTLRKFAPMGSAVCFPTQCILYTLVGIRQYLLKFVGVDWKTSLKSPSSFIKVWRSIVYDDPYPGIKRRQPLRVFGDDILCDEHVTEDIIHVLDSLGFQVNVEKSFLGSVAFRESCGAYHWHGEDVSPIRFKVSHFGKMATLRDVGSLVDFANRAGDYGYRNLQRCLVHKVLEIPIQGFRRRDGTLNPIRFVGQRSEFGLFTNRSEDERNHHLRRRIFDPARVGKGTHYDWQRDEVRCIHVKTPMTIDHSDLRDRMSYIEWWRAAYLRGDSSDLESPANRYDEIKRGRDYGWRWMPT